jgi:PAS domain S-box-containing protein
MWNRRSLFWKLSGLFVVTIVTVIGAMGYVNRMLDERYAISSARDVCRFNAETILRSLQRLMMSRDNVAIAELIDNLVENTASYRDIRLVSHGGEVAASRLDSGEETVQPTSGSCRVCHDLENPMQGTTIRSHDRIVELPGGQRAVSVVTPILNEPNCRTADCHAHVQSGPVLGFLETEFSLASVETLIGARRLQTLIAMGIAILLSIAATWLTMNRLIERPIRALISGMRRIAAGDFGFRFGLSRKDEIGLVAESFDHMTGELASGLSELRETRDYLEGIVESSADIIITVNPAGLIQTFNAGAENALGYGREEVIGRRIEMLFADPRERDAAIARLQDTDNVVNYETHFLTKRGQVKDVILTLSRLREVGGRPIGTFGISKDVTNEKRLQRELIQAERLAAVGQALTGIQHSMKNMLNALQGGSYLVRTGMAKSDRKMLEDGWRMVQEGIASMTALSSNMLGYVKDWRPEFKKVDLGEVAAKIHRVVGQTARDRGVDLHLELPGPLPLVNCDPELIHSAVMDVVSNALAACEEKRYGNDETPEVVICLKAIEDGNAVKIVVRDNGCGMTEQVRARIFAPFFSAKEATGTGLGLALVSRIVSVHGGSVGAESEPGRGSVFHILVPVHRSDENDENKEDRDGEEGARGR